MNGTTRRTTRRTRTFALATDAFVMDQIRHARERGIREERERVCAWLRTFPDPYTDGPSFANGIEVGHHDAGRTFPPLPPEDPTP